MTALSISLLGSFEAALDNEPLTQFRTKSVQGLLIYLVCEANRTHQREALMTMLWPGMPLASAQANLRQTLYRLRKIIPEVKGKNGENVPFLNTTRQTIQINPDAEYNLDVDAFVVSERSQVIALYRGDFLADFYLPDSEAFEEWSASRRADYRRQVLEMLEGETADYIQQANYEEAIKLAQRQLEIDNLRESSHRQLMEAWARNGRRQESLTHYNHLRQLLQNELAIEPEPETMTLVEAIRAGELSRTASLSAPKSTPSDKASTRPKHNLPQRLTSFVGREKEMVAITDLIGQYRLVMLTGVGGIGKTNLSLQVGRRMLDAFPDGVWLVELAPLADPALISQTAGSALGLAESSDRPMMETLLNYLQAKSCLLILDNCEHLIDAAAQFVQILLQSCPDLKLLASSREALAVPGEVTFQVPSLSFPDSAQHPSLDELAQYEAARLFVDRATAVLPTFQVTSENIEPLMQICRRLDGIPLALELAAARVKILALAQIAERLDDRFRLLTSGSRTALPRQQTLRALINWSWDLLTELEQLLLQRLSVFAGSISLEAIEAICAGDDLDGYEILDLLNELVNKSLVIARRQQGQATRYYMLETIRQYGQERLAAAGQLATFRQNHLRYFQQLVEKNAPFLMHSKQGMWLNLVQRELDNIRAALLWAQEADVETGLKLIWAMSYFCWARGYYSEMETRLTQLLSKSESIPLHLKAKVLWSHGLFNFILSRFKQTCRSLEESLAIYYRLEDDPVGIARTLRLLGYTVAVTREFDEGHGYLQESVALMRMLEDQEAYKGELAESLVMLGEIEMEKYPQQAKGYFRESELILREVGDYGRLAWNLGKSGTLALSQGDYEAAQAMFEESLAFQEMLDLRESGFTLVYLGELYTKLGNFSQAEAYYERILSDYGQTEYHQANVLASVALGNVYLQQNKLAQAEQTFIKSRQYFEELDDHMGVVYALERLACVAARRRQPEKAVKLYAWADGMRQGSRPNPDQEAVDQDMAAIRRMMDEQAIEAAYAAGQVMTVEQATALAVEKNIISEE